MRGQPFAARALQGSALAVPRVTPDVSRAVFHGLVLAGLLFGGYLFVVLAPQLGTVGFDAWSYWRVDPAAPYDVPLGGLGSFPYSPALALLFAPAGILPFWQFLWLWLAVLIATCVWLGGTRALAVLAFPPVSIELYHGNIHLMLAAAIVLGLRYPAAWSFVLLAKVTPGVGLVWFAVRREWRALALALGATAVIGLVSYAVVPGAWHDWGRYLSDGAGHPPPNQLSLGVPLPVRVALAAAIVAWGARTDRVWTVPVGATLALPVMWVAGLSLLVAIPAAARLQQRREPSRGSSVP